MITDLDCDQKHLNRLNGSDTCSISAGTLHFIVLHSLSETAHIWPQRYVIKFCASRPRGRPQTRSIEGDVTLIDSIIIQVHGSNRGHAQ